MSATTGKRTAERAQFLANVLSTAIEHNRYGFPGIVEYVCDVPNPADVYAVIFDRYDEEDAYGEWQMSYTSEDYVPTKTYRVTVDTIASGLGKARKLYTKPAKGSTVSNLFLADRTNGEDGDVDVIGALLVLECALFGRQMYS